MNFPTTNGKGETIIKWVDGILVQAMKRGEWLVVEEFNFMPEEISSVFYSVMDDRRSLTIDEHKGELVQAHPDFRLFMTGNWGYKGTTIPNDAIRNRIDMTVDIPYLPETQESNLLVSKTGVSKDIANLISKFAWSQRKIQNRYQPDISTRILVRMAILITGGMNPVDAGGCTVVTLITDDEQEKHKLMETLKFTFEGA